MCREKPGFNPPTTGALARNTDAWYTRMKDWKEWAALHSSLTEEEKELAKGPRRHITMYGRAEIRSVTFAAESVEHNKKATDSIIMIKTGSALCGGAEFGRIKSFMEVLNPGSLTVKSSLASVAWFKVPPMSAARLDWNEVIACPVVFKSYKSDPLGNFWDVSGIVPTKIILVPHHVHKENMWQVLHADSDFLTKEY